MKTNQTLHKTLKAGIFAAALFCSSTLFAQVKIGSNPTTINAANNLEVESADPAKKVSIDKTTGKVTIADGSQGVDKVLTSDAAGVATWVAPASQDVPVFISAYKAAGTNQALGAGGAITKVNYGAEEFDKSNNFDVTTDAFTVPANGAGYYQISGSYTCAPVTGQTFGIGLYMYVNGVNERAIVRSAQNGSGSVTYKFNAGDVVTFYVQTSFAGATMTQAVVDIFMISK